MPDVEQRHTFCRICEASCGIVAGVQDQRVVSIAPIREHHGTLGFSCMKGLHQHKMYDSPDRLRYPLKRVGDGFERISWDQALREIGGKLRQLRGVSPHSIGMYVGTAAAGFLGLAAAGTDVVTALSGSVSALATYGPALGELGVGEPVSALGGGAMAVLGFLMFAGRIEHGARRRDPRPVRVG